MLIFTVVAMIALIAAYVRSRLNELELRIREVSGSAPTWREFDRLLRRVNALESSARVRYIIPPPAPPLPKEDGRVSVPEPVREPVVEYEPPFPSYPLPVAVQHSEPGLAKRIRNRMGNEEWETLVGGSLLNKIGAVILVIGIALFLRYSLGHVGSAGRAFTSIALSSALLVAGVRAEQRPRFKVFSRGLIGAGWAALYATAYAIYAVPATRIISNPFAGSVILILVSCGMILHSLRYRSQAVTGITYFAAFAAVAVSPSTPFAVLSLIPIAASILYLAWKFDWYSMALFGVVATYLTCISKGDAHASLAGSQTLLIAYWVLFECFDWLRMRRRAVSGGVEWIFPANAIGFLGMSYMAWAAHSPAELWLATGCASALYLISAVIRFRVRPPASFEPAQPLAVRLRAGSFEGATLIAAILAGLAIFGRVTGVWTSFGLALDAELIYLAGVAFGSVFLRRAGAGAFTISLVSLGTTVGDSSRTAVLNHAFWNWSPGALVHAALFYINREIRRKGFIFSTAAAALVGIVLAVEVPQEWAGVACALFGILLLYVGLKRRLFEFRTHCYVLAAGGFLWTAGLSVAGGAWEPLAVCLVLACIVTGALMVTKRDSLALLGGTAAVVVLSSLLLWRVLPADYLGIGWCLLTVVFLELGLRGFPSALLRFFLPMTILTAAGIAVTHSSDLAYLPPFATWATYLVACLACVASVVRLSSPERYERSPEEILVRSVICVLGVASAAVLTWLLVPAWCVSLVWMLIAISLVEVSRRFRVVGVVSIAIGLAALAYCRVLFADLQDTWNIPVRLFSSPLFIVALYGLRARFAAVGKNAIGRAMSWFAVGPFLALTFVEAKDERVAVYWMAGALALLLYGTLRKERDFRLQGYCVAGLSLAATVWFDLSPVRLAVSIPVAAAFYSAQFILRREQERMARMYFGLAASALVAAILYSSVSGHMLTVAWGIEGLLLLGAGFGLRDRVFRLQGLAVLLVCSLKLFFYDLRNLDTPYRILSFIVLGIILLVVSWTYSRFREQLRRIL